MGERHNERRFLIVVIGTLLLAILVIMGVCEVFSARSPAILHEVAMALTGMLAATLGFRNRTGDKDE
jgi:hypothetical protein